MEGDGWSRRSEILHEVEQREGHDAIGLDYLFYVCVHCCAAIEPEEVHADAHPVPRPQYCHRPPQSTRCGSARARAGHGADHRPHSRLDGRASRVTPTRPSMTRSRRTRAIPQDGGHGTFTAGCVRVTAPEADVHVVNAAELPRGSEPAPDAIGAVFESDLADLLRTQLVADEGATPSRCPTSWC